MNHKQLSHVSCQEPGNSGKGSGSQISDFTLGQSVFPWVQTECGDEQGHREAGHVPLTSHRIRVPSGPSRRQRRPGCVSHTSHRCSQCLQVLAGMQKLQRIGEGVVYLCFTLGQSLPEFLGRSLERGREQWGTGLWNWVTCSDFTLGQSDFPQVLEGL